jgi:hypothetical protein
MSHAIGMVKAGGRSARKPYGSREKSRAQIAAELVERIARGPDIFPSPGQPALSADEFKQRYRAWASSWVLDELRYLIAKDLP